MTDKPSSKSPRRSFAELLDGIESAANPDRELIRLTIEREKEKDPRLADLMRACAIPRWFDEEVIGVLRDELHDAAENARLFKELRRNSFVLTARDGGSVYHDSVRALLLAEWREPAHREEFDRLNQRLVAFYEARHKEAQRDEEHWGQVATIVRRANPARFARIASRLEAQLVAPLLEALYHETLGSAEAGYEYFTRHAFEFEAGRRLTICESLLNALLGYIELLPPELRAHSRARWLRYWKARIARQLGRHREAEELLRALLASDEGPEDTLLELWSLDELGTALQNQERFHEAREQYELQLALGLRTNLDPYNIPLNYVRLATLHWTLDELPEAAEKYRQAIRAAQSAGNRGLQGSTLLDLAGLLHALGQWDQAIDTAIEADEFIRRNFPADANMRQTLLGRLRGLVARRDPRLLDTFYAETRALVSLAGDPTQRLDLENEYADFLRQSGRYAKAEVLLSKQEREFAASPDPAHYSEFLIRRALLREDQGQMKDAAGDYTEVIARGDAGKATPWQHSVGLHNRGLCRMESFELDSARADLEQVRERWLASGRINLAVFALGSLAEIARRQGNLAKAQECLDIVRQSSTTGTNPSYLASFHRIQGHVYRDQAKWDAAAEQYRKAIACRRSLDEWAMAAVDLNSLAGVASSQGNWEEAARHSAEAHSLWSQLAATNSYRPSDDARRANELNARAVQNLRESGYREALLAESRDLFKQAIALAPDNFWYYLNLADVCGEREDWDAVVEALQSALAQCPGWMRSPALRVRLAGALCRQAKADAAQGALGPLGPLGPLGHGSPRALDALARSRTLLEEAQAAHHGQFSRLAEVWRDLGDGLFQLDRAEEACEAYQAGLEYAETTGDTDTAAELHARLAFLAAVREEPGAATRHFQNSLSLRADSEDAAEALVQGCAALARSTEERIRLNAALRAFLETPDLDPAQRTRLAAARYDMLRSSVAVSAPSVEAIVVEAEDGIFPTGDNWWESHPLFKDHIPGMRSRIESELGYRVPPVRIRSNDASFTPDTYLFMLRETPIVMGSLSGENAFCHDPAAAAELAEEEIVLRGFNPRTGDNDGAWITDAARERLGADLVWDKFEYLIRHLEFFLRPRLTELFGVQEAGDQLTAWREQGDADERERRAHLIEAALPDAAARARFAHLLRALLREQVTILDLEPILAAFDPSVPEITPLAEAARLRLRQSLPGNDAAWQHLRLPEEFEAEVQRWVQPRNGRTTFAVPPAETQELLATARERLADAAKTPTAVVVRQAVIRPYLRRLLELEFPHVPVLSEAELNRSRQESDHRGEG